MSAAMVRDALKIDFEFQRGGMSRTFTASHWRVENVRLLEAAVGEGKLPRDRFDRALLVTVLGEIPDRERALREIFDALKPGGRLSVTEVIFDPHFQSRRSVARLAHSSGFRENAFHGNRIAYTLNFEKPSP